jgi:hypothetical protein
MVFSYFTSSVPRSEFTRILDGRIRDELEYDGMIGQSPSYNYQIVRLSAGWWLALLGKLFNHLLWYRAPSPCVLVPDDTQRRLNVDDLDAGVIVSEQVDPTSPGLPQEIGGIEGKGSPRSKQFSASLPG